MQSLDKPLRRRFGIGGVDSLLPAGALFPAQPRCTTVPIIDLPCQPSTNLALYLEVSGEANGVYTYDMWFEDESDAGPSDVVQRFGELSLVISAASVARLRGATLEFGESGLAIRNPNAQ